MLLRISFLLLFCPFVSHASQSDEAVTLEAGTLRIGLDSAGHVVSLLDTVAARDHSVPHGSGPLLSIETADRTEHPTRMTYDGKRRHLTLTYSDGINATIEVLQEPTHVTFELKTLSVTPKRILWGPLATTIGRTIGETIGVVRDEAFAIGVQALNVKTTGGARAATAGSSLYAECRDHTRIIPAGTPGRCDTPSLAGSDATVVGSGIALFGCPADRVLEVIGRIELAEGLPHPMLDGVWAKMSPEATRSYLISPFNESVLDAVLAVAKQAGFKYIYHGNPFKSWGHFEFNPDEFPDGDESMRRCVDRAAAAGIRIGAHTLSNFIQPNDPYVTPVPDPRLLRSGTATLTSAVKDDATDILVDDPAPFRKRGSLSTVVIGDELVRYQAVTDTAPWKLVGCRRGAFGTKAAGHAAGAEIGKLADHDYQTFFPSIEMQDEMALRLAALWNRTGLRQISFDGLEGCQATGYGAYAEARFVKTTFDNWNHDVINDSSQLKHYTWHIHTRMNWGEPWGKAMREGMPEYRFKNQEYFQRNLLPPMLGWFEIRISSPELQATSLDEVEWVLAKCAGFGAGCAWQTSLYALERLGNKEAILTAIREWDLARHSGVFTEAQRTRLRESQNEFHLDKAGDGSWELVPVAFSPPFFHAVANGEDESLAVSHWEFTNRFVRQPLQFTLRVVAVEGQKEDGSVGNPSFEIDGRRLSVPVRLSPEQYLVCGGDGTGLVYDANWNLVKSFRMDNPMPMLSEGNQNVRFRCEFAGAPEPRVEVRFKVIGAPEAVK